MAERIAIDLDRCTGCGACLPACPEHAISLVEGRAYIDEARCRGCEACVPACPTGALIPVVAADIVAARDTGAAGVPTAVPLGPAEPQAASLATTVKRTAVVAVTGIAVQVVRIFADAVAQRLLASLSGASPASKTSQSDLSATQITPRGDSGTPLRGGRQHRHRQRGRS